MKTKEYLLALALLALVVHSAWAAPFGTSITYQGRLNDPKGPANGLYDFQFYAYTSEGGFSGYTVETNGVSVSNGLFTVLLDFGPGVFTGEARWLQIWVRSNSVAVPPEIPEPFTMLTPRQPLTATPFAHFAAAAGGVPSASITGVNLASNSVTAAKIAPGQVVKTLNGLTDTVAISAGTNVNIQTGGANNLIISATPGTVVTNAGWSITGNSGTTANNFVGTTDGQPLELRVNNQRAMRLENSSGWPNVIGGSSANSAGAQIRGGTIGGGNGNTFPSSSDQTDCPTIGGGIYNTIEPWAYYATISGGYGNRIQYDGDSAVIAGGQGNVVGTNADFSAIGGGQNNTIASAVNYGMIPGGYNNSVAATGGMAAGRNAHVQAGHEGSFVWGDGSQAANSAGSNRFDVLARGGFGFYTASSALTMDAGGNLGVGGKLTVNASNTAVQAISTGRDSVTITASSTGSDAGTISATALGANATALYGEAEGGPGAWAVCGRSSRGYAGYFIGNVQVNGDTTFGGNANFTGNATISGLATLGTITLAPPAVLNFGNSTRQMINLYNHDYAIGVQPSAEYFRSAGGYYWFNGGSHSGTNGDPGAGGSTLMSLDASGNAIFNGTVTGNANAGGTIGVKGTGSTYGIWGIGTGSGWAGYFNGSVKVLGDTTLEGSTTAGDINVTRTSTSALNFGNNTRQMINLYDTVFGLGVQTDTEYFRSDWGFAWYKGGVHDNAETNAGGGAMLMYLSQDGLSVNGNVACKVLTVLGADVAEPFQMSSAALAKGSVVVIDEDHPGQLKQSTSAYDTRVAGIISGAGGVQPGLSLQQLATEKDGQNVALTGRVYVQADASNGAIKPGDLLTTSDTPGHAMKVTDQARAQGAILGKAMTGLARGQGLVLVLVTLQ